MAPSPTPAFTGNMSKLNTYSAIPVMPARRKSLTTTPGGASSSSTSPTRNALLPTTKHSKLHKAPHNTPAFTSHANNTNPNFLAGKERAGTPRNRLKKRAQTLPILPSEATPTTYFILSHDAYPANTAPSQFLGVYSSIDAVTAAAFRHGAYTFSREGLLDGSEYLAPTGRIKISSAVVQRSGVKAGVVERGVSKEGEVVRLDIPHPAAPATKVGETTALVPWKKPSRTSTDAPSADSASGRETVYLAIHEGPRSALVIGAFSSKELAWGACLKDKAWLAWSDTLVDEERGFEEDNMPRLSARVVGSGRVSWCVKGCEVDCAKTVVLRGGGLLEGPGGAGMGMENREDVGREVALFEVERRGYVGEQLPPGCRDV